MFGLPDCATFHNLSTLDLDRSFSISRGLSRHDFNLISSGIHHYKKLKSLSLHFGQESLPLEHLYSLETLVVRVYRKSDIQDVVNMLNVTHKLRSLKINWGADAHSIADLWPDLCTAVKKHPCLRCFGLAGNIFLFSELLQSLHMIAAENDNLETFDLTSCRDVNPCGFVDNNLSSLKSIKNYLLPLTNLIFHTLWHFERAMRENLSITCLQGEGHVLTYPPLMKLLARNRLYQAASKSISCQKPIPAGMLPQMLARAGSNHGEPTPVFALTRGAAEIFSSIVSRKREAHRSYDSGGITHSKLGKRVALLIPP